MMRELELMEAIHRAVDALGPLRDRVRAPPVRERAPVDGDLAAEPHAGRLHDPLQVVNPLDARSGR
jgi:hypothetical protein